MNETLEVDVDALHAKLRDDNRFFINWLLVDEITPATPVPDFHVRVLDLMMNSSSPRDCFAIPRDHAKTTLAKLAAVKFLLFTEFRFILYISNTGEIAIAATKDIIGFIESPNFIAYHAAICGALPIFKVRQEGMGYYEFIIFPGTPREKHCIIKSLGAGKQVRGMNVDNQRPELAIADDIESNETIETDLGYAKHKKWFYGTFYKALSKLRNKVIMLGNMTANRCMIKDHCDSKHWSSFLFGSIKGDGTPLWPEVWPIEKLRLDFDLYIEQGQAATWMAEMMNMPVGDGLGLIRAEEIYYLPQTFPEEIEYGFITVDPAISRESWAHRTGITVHGYKEPCWQSVETFAVTGLDLHSLFDKLIELAYKWGISVIGIEAVAFQKAIKPLFEIWLIEKHIQGITFVDLVAGARKAERFASFASLVKGKQYALNKADHLLTQQLLIFDPRKKDNDCDLLDSTAYAPQMIEKYMHLIMSKFAGGLPKSEGFIPVEQFSDF